MTEFYRFRSTARLLEKSQELATQTIYFASPQELNDPMEGFRNIVWQGDRIVWANLFRHYLYCLCMTHLFIKFVGDSKKIKPQDIPIMSDMSQEPSTQAVNLFEDICGRVFKKTNLDEFFAKIVNAERKARHDEVLFYLQFLHYTALQEIRDAHIDHGLASNGEKRGKSAAVFRNIHKILDLTPQIEDEKLLDVLFESSAKIIKDNLFRYKYLFASESKENVGANKELLFCDFPRAYLKQLERLLYPDWYVACFMRDFRNSSVWGNYGDNHKGVCLIFAAETTSGKSCLKLNQFSVHSRERWDPITLPFHEVNYLNKAGEIDFFLAIGWLPKPILLKQWYGDKDGKLSECGAHLGTDGEDAWRKNYWDNFYRDTTIKTPDWEYEQESRLVLTDMLCDLSDKRLRTLTYNFSSLKGIIFGINTSDTDKLRIIQAIPNKCQANNRTDFEFFQAYYCNETGKIQKYKLHI